jgi:NADH-quinone oxidoreductase subunit G
VMGGRKPKLLMDIHKVSEVNKPNVHLSEIEGPATKEVFEKGNRTLLENNSPSVK